MTTMLKGQTENDEKDHWKFIVYIVFFKFWKSIELCEFLTHNSRLSRIIFAPLIKKRWENRIWHESFLLTFSLSLKFQSKIEIFFIWTILLACKRAFRNETISTKSSLWSHFCKWTAKFPFGNFIFGDKQKQTSEIEMSR